MKSIMQEGSTVMKAIEKAWQTAGQPREFSVKIFEEPKHNFIGMTTQAAKIGIFFEERKIEEQESRKFKKPIKRFPEERERQQPSHRAEFTQRPREERPVIKKHQPVQDTERQPRMQPEQLGIIWSDEMIVQAQEWLKQTLAAMNKSVAFQTSTNNYQLRFNFADPIFEDVEQERNLFRSLSFLLLQTLKRKFKRPLRGFKVVLTRLA